MAKCKLPQGVEKRIAPDLRIIISKIKNIYADIKKFKGVVK